MSGENQVVNKITPKFDISWYIKWVSSIILVIGASCTSVQLVPLNLWCGFTGCVGWTTVGFMWHDRALILLNGVTTFIFLSGLIKYYAGI